MFIVHVNVHVKPELVEAFIEATIENARSSVQEPGIARFDVIQQLDDPTRFVLIEVYRSESAPAEHKKTAHYQAWRNTVAEMMAEPRSSVKYDNVFPDDEGWG
jgi:autoinducer 2-degrading protein